MSNGKPNVKVRPGWAGSGDHITNKGIAKRKAEESTSAATLRKKILKRDTNHTPTCEPLYPLENGKDVIVALHGAFCGTTNAVVVGLEWGGANINLGCRPCWFYHVKPDIDWDPNAGITPWKTVTEDEIAGRIS